MVTLHILLWRRTAIQLQPDPSVQVGTHACALFPFVTAYWWAKSVAALPLLSEGGEVG